MLKVIKESDDPIATRISAGGNQDGNYMVYRGDLNDVKRIMQEILNELNTYNEN